MFHHKTRLLACAGLLLLAPLAGAGHSYTSADFYFGSYVGAGVDATLVCVGPYEDEWTAPRPHVGGACVLDSPSQERIHIHVEHAGGFVVSFKWYGLTDEGGPCGQSGEGLEWTSVEPAPGCTHFGVSPGVGNVAGTITLHAA